MKALRSLSQSTQEGVEEASEARAKSLEFNLRGRADLFVCVAHRRQGAEESPRATAPAINPF